MNDRPLAREFHLTVEQEQARPAELLAGASGLSRGEVKQVMHKGGGVAGA